VAGVDLGRGGDDVEGEDSSTGSGGISAGTSEGMMDDKERVGGKMALAVADAGADDDGIGCVWGDAILSTDMLTAVDLDGTNIRTSTACLNTLSSVFSSAPSLTNRSSGLSGRA
jgi:hypothetical protein